MNGEGEKQKKSQLPVEKGREKGSLSRTKGKEKF